MGVSQDQTEHKSPPFKMVLQQHSGFKMSLSLSYISPKSVFTLPVQLHNPTD